MTEPKRYTVKIDCHNQTFDSIEDPEGQWIFDPDHKIDLRNLTRQFSRPDNAEPDHCYYCGYIHKGDCIHLQKPSGG